MFLLLPIWDNTVKFLNFGTPEIFAVIYLNFKQRGQTYKRVFCQKDANVIANSDDPDETAPKQSDLGLHCLPRHICPKTYGHYGCGCKKVRDILIRHSKSSTISSTFKSVVGCS